MGRGVEGIQDDVLRRGGRTGGGTVMRTIIAGSRTCFDYGALLKAVQYCGWQPTEIISGMARGVDALGVRYAVESNLPLHKFPAEWDIYGKSAGFVRNKEMAEAAEALIALWDGYSRGTSNMIDIARDRGLRIFVKEVK